MTSVAKPATNEPRPSPGQYKAAFSLGSGVPAAVVEPPDKTPKPVERKSLSSSASWKDKPQYPDQISAADEVRQVRLEVHLLNLTKVEDLTKYQELLNLEYDAMSNRHVLTHERRFVESQGGYLAYMEVGVFEFKQILPDNLHGKTKPL